MAKNLLYSLDIKSIKGIKNAKINFSESLTAIMGINGSGKTTILHILACIYEKEFNGESYKFRDFFVPTPDAQWAGSELLAHYWQGEVYERDSQRGKAGERINKEKRYTKKTDRWAPRYDKRPKRAVFYLGIETCLPEIEKMKSNGGITYTTITRKGKLPEKVINNAAHILDKDYHELLEHTTRSKKLHGVQLKGGLKYSALSMGTGEQRIIKMLEVIFDAPDYSMILIDEIDLLLHINALTKLLNFIKDKAKEKNLQIIFTTHALSISEFDFIKIQYIEHTPTQTLVHTAINTGMILSMTGIPKRSIKIYVEDAFAQAIVRKIAKELNMCKKIDVHLFGAAENSFTLAASIILREEPKENILIVLDGDVHRTLEEKKKRIEKVLTGTEDDIGEKQDNAVSIINQFSLPDGLKPEEYIHKLLSDEENELCELVVVSRGISNVADKHKYINSIAYIMGDTYDVVVDNILSIVSKKSGWTDYTANIRAWLKDRAEL